MTEPKQPNRRNRRVNPEATQEVASSIQPPVEPQVKQEGLPHSNGAEKRVERLPSGLVIVHP